MEDDDMEVEEVYEVHEVDLDYEYDAARFFDFCREETPDEAAEAEQWFDSARSCPPSPFAVKLLLRDTILSGNNNEISPHSGDVENAVMVINSESNNVLLMQQSVQSITKDEGKDCRTVDGRIFGILQSEGSRLRDQTEKAKTAPKNPVKARGSNLMKFTASARAKQNQVNRSRFNMMPAQTNQRILSSGTESQASKRQKIEGGHLFKVVEEKQPISLVHKAPKQDGCFEKIPRQKLRITIPKEPDLETATRAQRTRLKTSTEMEESLVNVRRFKARPLNRKILEAPQLPLSQKSTPKLPEFQLFHLKTSERAMQHTSTSSSPAVKCDKSDKELCKNDRLIGTGNGSKAMGRMPALDSSRQDGSLCYNFKAHPLNRKILSSKGDMGVFRNSKRGVTIPNEFNFQPSKRTVHDLSAELLSKLNLKSELQPINQPTKSPRPPCLSMKGSKENRFSAVSHKHEIERDAKEKLPPYRLKQFNHGRQEAAAEDGPMLGLRTVDMR